MTAEMTADGLPVPRRRPRHPGRRAAGAPRARPRRSPRRTAPEGHRPARPARPPGDADDDRASGTCSSASRSRPAASRRSPQPEVPDLRDGGLRRPAARRRGRQPVGRPDLRHRRPRATASALVFDAGGNKVGTMAPPGDDRAPTTRRSTSRSTRSPSEVYVTDRLAGAIYIYDRDGAYQRDVHARRAAPGLAAAGPRLRHGGQPVRDRPLGPVPEGPRDRPRRRASSGRSARPRSSASRTGSPSTAPATSTSPTATTAACSCSAPTARSAPRSAAAPARATSGCRAASPSTAAAACSWPTPPARASSSTARPAGDEPPPRLPRLHRRRGRRGRPVRVPQQRRGRRARARVRGRHVQRPRAGLELLRLLAARRGR